MDYYDEYGDYDVADHMMSDPVGFAMHGYGGFGYDTDDVKPDGKHSKLYQAAEKGDLKAVKRLIEQQKNKDEESKLKMINEARRWTEVEYKYSGFTKEFEWFDRTPLMIAIVKGHLDVVKCLLENGANPTLEACPRDDVYVSAKKDAEEAVEQAKRKCAKVRKVLDDNDTSSFTIDQIRPLFGNCASLEDCAWMLLERVAHAQRVCGIIDAVIPFWEGVPGSNSRSSYGKRTFGLPEDMTGMLETLHGVNTPVVDRTAESEEFKKLLEGLRKLKPRYDKRQQRKRKRGANHDSQRGQQNKKKRSRNGAKKHDEQSRRQTKCKFFAKGTCRFGDGCRFSHDL